MRKVFECSLNGDTGFVCKQYKMGDQSMLKRDIVMQFFAKGFSDRFNATRVPKKVTFLVAYLLVDPERHECFLLERKLAGEYVKHNNNSGFVQRGRNTPQAFSHFTYENSGREMMVVDIQGCGDCYTDPQIHTFVGGQFSGDLGTDGILAFFKTHKCNELCRELGLTPVNGLIDPNGETLMAQARASFPNF